MLTMPRVQGLGQLHRLSVEGLRERARRSGSSWFLGPRRVSWCEHWRTRKQNDQRANRRCQDRVWLPAIPNQNSRFTADGSVENFKRRRQTELKHGRISMLVLWLSKIKRVMVMFLRFRLDPHWFVSPQMLFSSSGCAVLWQESETQRRPRWATSLRSNLSAITGVVCGCVLQLQGLLTMPVDAEFFKEMHGYMSRSRLLLNSEVK